jgi:hypothetical protein
MYRFAPPQEDHILSQSLSKTRTLMSMPYVVDFVCPIIFWWEVIARFVDIGGIVDHHMLSFIFRMITKAWTVIVLNTMINI